MMTAAMMAILVQFRELILAAGASEGGVLVFVVSLISDSRASDPKSSPLASGSSSVPSPLCSFAPHLKQNPADSGF